MDGPTLRARRRRLRKRLSASLFLRDPLTFRGSPPDSEFGVRGRVG
ncbi:MAG: hypothetical protein QOG89_2313 [Thermomicrobiales bacterium]|nr:hypothetical protein [Thermomicrobiales bacterium]